MGAVKSVHIFCDNCRETFGATDPAVTATDCRDNAAEEDWLYTGGKDLCPICRPVTKEGYYKATDKKAVPQLKAVNNSPESDGWVKVITAADCIYEPWDTDQESPVCPKCKTLYSECSCPGPTMDDEYTYKHVNGIMYAKKRQNGII